jgi:hypothetical protein
MNNGTSTPNVFRRFSTSNPAAEGCNSDLAQYSHTPVLHLSARAGIEHEDDDEDEDESAL